MKSKFFFFLFISNISLVVAQIEATRCSGIPIAQDSILFYNDTCVFTCPYQKDVLDIQWTLDILYNPTDKPQSVNVLSIPFDEGEKGDLPTFRNIEIPRFDGRFILKEPNTYYISAEIVSVQKDAMSLTRTRLPIYLDLSPEKPRMEVILIEPEEGLDLTAEEPYGWWKVRFRLLPMSDNAPPATGKFLHIESWADGAIWDKAFVNDTVEADNFYGKEDFFQPLYTNRFGWKYGDTIYPYRYVAGVEPIEHSETLTAYLSREEREIYVKNNGSTQAIQRIEIFDVTGRILKTIESRDLLKVVVDATDLPRGLLVVQVATKKKIHVFKIWN